MSDFLRVILPIYFIVYFGVAIVLKSVIFSKLEKVPFVIDRFEDLDKTLII